MAVGQEKGFAKLVAAGFDLTELDAEGGGNVHPRSFRIAALRLLFGSRNCLGQTLRPVGRVVAVETFCCSRRPKEVGCFGIACYLLESCRCCGLLAAGV